MRSTEVRDGISPLEYARDSQRCSLNEKFIPEDNRKLYLNI
jgi:hypothetical protein